MKIYEQTCQLSLSFYLVGNISQGKMSMNNGQKVVRLNLNLTELESDGTLKFVDDSGTCLMSLNGKKISSY